MGRVRDEFFRSRNLLAGVCVARLMFQYIDHGNTVASRDCEVGIETIVTCPVSKINHTIVIRWSGFLQ
jgi:hypothetical protein